MMRELTASGSSPRSGRSYRTVGPVVVLVGSAVALGVAPAAMPESYSWVQHTTSESAAQGVPGAWIARLGFLLFGLGVLWQTSRAGPVWRQPAIALHVGFGVCMTAVAAFSARPWYPEAIFDRTEDLLHSGFATAMGFAFAFGVLTVAAGSRRRWRPLDVVAVVAAVALPLAMTAWGSGAGMFQRAMFVIAYLWYGHEAATTPVGAPAGRPARAPEKGVIVERESQEQEAAA
jgi:hypothetical protein